MKAQIKITKTVDLVTLHVKAGVRYWEDTTVNGVKDENGTLIPCREGDYWCPIINIETGIITNWTKGTTASTHYKVCGDGVYTLKDETGNVEVIKDYYVPDILDLYDDSYGDYIILNIDENGQIADWNNNPSIEDFLCSE